MSYVAEIDYIPSQNTGEVNSKKSRQISVGVYWYPETKKRFTLEVRKEQDKQVQKEEFQPSPMVGCVKNSLSNG
jgi:hypothetical protein